MRLTTGQALVRWLIAQRTELLDGTEAPLFPAVFAIFGHGNVLGLGTALAEHRAELPVWRGHNEQGMALAAIGYAKATDRRQVGVVTTSIGPGALNRRRVSRTPTGCRCCCCPATRSPAAHPTRFCNRWSTSTTRAPP
jgi:TPP-dependent trihydroxycyclohexane-1,2-dione (THcHDO) dehydratase